MKRASLAQAGFTIVETMIFLAVTGALVAIVLVSFGGRIGNAQFTQAVNEFDTQIKGIFNDVAAGTYPTNPTFTCAIDPMWGRPLLSPSATDKQGANTDCIFLGKVLQPGVTGAPNDFNIYTVVGRRTVVGSTAVVASIADPNGAKPQQIDGLAPNDQVDLTDYRKLGAGLNITKIVKVRNGTVSTIGGIGVFQTLGSYSGGADPRLNSGSQTIQIWPMGDSFPLSKSELHNITNNSGPNGTYANNIVNPNGGITICIDGGSANQKASIALGAVAGKVATTVKFGDNPLCA